MNIKYSAQITEVHLTQLYGELTLVIHANAVGVEADIVLIFTAFVLSHAEQNSIFHLHPELTMFVF